MNKRVEFARKMGELSAKLADACYQQCQQDGFEDPVCAPGDGGVGNVFITTIDGEQVEVTVFVERRNHG